MQNLTPDHTKKIDTVIFAKKSNSVCESYVKKDFTELNIVQTFEAAITNNKGPVVRRVDNAIQRINHYPV